MQAHLSFDSISEETKFQLEQGGKLGSWRGLGLGGAIAPLLYSKLCTCCIAQFSGVVSGAILCLLKTEYSIVNGLIQ